jgi:hypothetical protein
MVTFAAAVVLVVVVVNKLAQALMLTCNKQMRSSNYGHDTNHCDQIFMFFHQSPQVNAVIVFYRFSPLTFETKDGL